MKKRIAHLLCEAHFALLHFLDASKVMNWAWDIEYPDDITAEEKARWERTRELADYEGAIGRLEALGSKIGFASSRGRFILCAHLASDLRDVMRLRERAHGDS